VSAGGNYQRARVRFIGALVRDPESFVQLAGHGLVRLVHLKVEFYVPRDFCPVTVQPERDDAAKIVFALHQREVDIREHPFYEGADDRVPADGPLRKAAVYDSNFRPARLCLADKPGPDLGFHQQYDGRFVIFQRFTDAEFPVEREVEYRGSFAGK
jgi:hypothetical protein